MAVLKPTLSMPNFDATKDYVLTFNLDSSSDQCFGNRIIIYDNSTNVILYDNTITSFLLQHTIPAGTLSNGTIYKITIAYFNYSNTYSSFSDGIIFKCLATPAVSISNLTPDQVVASNNFTPTGTWTQSNGDTLNTYEFYLYDGNGILLQSSQTLFYSPSNTIQYQFTNLLNNTRYGVNLYSLSTSGMEVTTEIVYFTVQYVAPTFAGTLSLENVPDQGAIQISSDVIQIIGKIGSGSINYINNDYVNLTQGMIYFSNVEGMSIFSDFTFEIFAKNISIDVPFLTLVTPQGTITLCWKSWNNCITATKKTNDGISEYTIFGQMVNLTIDNNVYIFLQQIRNYLNLEYEILSY